MFRYHAKHDSHNEEFKLWTSDNHPEEIYSDSFFRCKLNYIHQNPVRAGIVSHPAHYIYSSAANYENREGLISIDSLHW